MRKTVLIIEDNASVRHAFCELLEACGVAENGREAIEAAGRQHSDFIVPDLFMPGGTASMLRVRLDVWYPDRNFEIMSKVDPPALPFTKARTLADIEVGR